MKRALLLTLFLLVYATPVAGQAPENEGFTKHKSSSAFAVSDKRRFSIEMDIEGGSLKVGVNRAEIFVHSDDDRDLKGVRLTLEPWMPSMDHGVTEKPVITEKEGFFGARYLVDNLMISMGGDWEIRVDAEKDGVRDKAVLLFPDVGGKGGMTMKGDAMTMPADLDLATIRTSEKKTLTAAYNSTPSPPPLNAIHSWSLSLKDSSGQPVAGAEIEVDGDMPEHGHGLPTAPEVVEETAPGTYLIEGMKFSMKGWWTVSLDIETGGSADRVVFNLLLK